MLSNVPILSAHLRSSNSRQLAPAAVRSLVAIGCHGVATGSRLERLMRRLAWQLGYFWRIECALQLRNPSSIRSRPEPSFGIRRSRDLERGSEGRREEFITF